MASKQQIALTVDGCAARAELLTDLSPRAATAFWESLPMEVTLAAGKWSGRAAWFEPKSERMAAVSELEYPVCSIYPGYFVMRPKGTEVLVAYGVSEYRWASGTDYVTPIARVTDGYVEFVRTLARMHDEGDLQLTLRRAS